jgi:nucleotide-binding universal stress UspA family protein
MSERPILIGYDGAPPSERAIRESGDLLAPRRALVVVVWEAGLVFEFADLPTVYPGLSPVSIDVRGALELDKALYEGAQRTAEKGAALAREAGFEAEGLAVADELTVAQTLVRLARERDARAVVVGSNRKRGLADRLLGSTSQEVARRAPCPTVVVNDIEGDDR